MLSRIFDTVQGPRTQQWLIMKNTALDIAYNKQNIVKIKKRRLTWAGYMSRMDNDRLPNAIFCGVVEWQQRRRERPSTRWRWT